MKNYFKKIIIIFHLLIISFFYPINDVYGKSIQKNIAILYTEEVVHDIHFSEKLQVINGTKKYIYTVDSQVVPYEEYLDQIVYAESQEIKNNREREHNARNLIIESTHKINIKVSIQELKQRLECLETELSKINANRLRSYMIFKDNTFNSYQEFLDISHNLIPEIDNLLDCKDLFSLDYVLIQEYINKINNLLPKLTLFFADTINNAVEKSDDTKMLKELLSVIV